MKFRKHIRLKNYDYEANGFYFVTICCSHENVVAECNVAAERSSALRYESIIEKHLRNLENYKGVKLDYFKIMSNHIHLILVLQEATKSLPGLIQDFKAKTTLEIKKEGFIGKRFWQPNYYEHIVRNEKSLAKIREYIENNPLVEKLNWDAIEKDYKAKILLCRYKGKKLWKK